jgi:glycosyltransferase involved in cell wall biosynthesis
MNILCISTHSFPRGMAGSKRIRLFAEYLATKHRVTVLVAGPGNGANPESGTEKNVAFKWIPTSRKQSIFGHSRIRKLLKNYFVPGAENVIFLYGGIGLTNRLYATIGKKLGYTIVTDIVEDYILHEENLSLRLKLLYRINVYFDRRVNRYADGIIVISSRLLEKYRKLRVPENKMVTIPVSAENIYSDVLSGKKTTEHFNFAYSGTYGNKDGVEDLVAAFREIAPLYPEARLQLAGKINQKISELIKGEEQIVYMGMLPDEDYYSFLAASNVLLMTRVNSGYANAGFPFKLGEYLATGVPVIATRVSDIELYLEDNRDVIIAEPSNIQSLADKFRYVLDHRDDLEHIGLNGRKKCERYFHPTGNGSLLEEFITRITPHA